MDVKLPTPKEAATAQAVVDDFHKRYGRALADWASIEYALHAWFRHLTGLQPAVSMAIFRSTSGFGGGLKMLEGAFWALKRGTAAEAFFEEIMTRIRSYYGFRNVLAHHLPIMVTPENKMMLVNHKDTFLQGEKVTSAELENASANFNSLCYLILETLPTGQATGFTPSEAVMQKLMSLPKKAGDPPLAPHADPHA